jgi:hypothetical protein
MDGFVLQMTADARKPENERFILHSTLPTADSERILIVAAHPDMLKWAAEFGHERVVSMDTTFGTTRYGYSLLTATVVDFEGRGKPVLFAIMSSESGDEISRALEFLEQHVQKILPHWRPSAFIIDDSDAERNEIMCAFCSSAAACLPSRASHQLDTIGTHLRP